MSLSIRGSFQKLDFTIAIQILSTGIQNIWVGENGWRRSGSRKGWLLILAVEFVLWEFHFFVVWKMKLFRAILLFLKRKSTNRSYQVIKTWNKGVVRTKAGSPVWCLSYISRRQTGRAFDVAGPLKSGPIRKICVWFLHPNDKNSDL